MTYAPSNAERNAPNDARRNAFRMRSVDATDGRTDGLTENALTLGRNVSLSNARDERTKSNRKVEAMSTETVGRLTPAPAAKGLSTSATEVQADAMAAIRDQLAACNGCGLTFATGDEHRPDCTVEPSPLLCEDCGALRLPSERSPIWRYEPNTRTYHCPTHQKGTTA